MVKKILLIITLVFLKQFFFAQENVQKSISNQNIIISDAVESMPLFNGDLSVFIKKIMIYPSKALIDKIEGRVIVSFWVDNKGKTIEHEIVKGIRDDLNQEALRVTKLIVFSKPAMSGGKPVKVHYFITVEFKLPIIKHCKCR